MEFKYAYKDGTYLYRSYELAETKKEHPKEGFRIKSDFRCGKPDDNYMADCLE